MKSRLEELRIVFSLDVYERAKQVLGDRTFGVLSPTEPLDILGVFHAIKDVLAQIGIRPNFQTYEGTPVSEKRVKARLPRYGIPYLRVDGLALQAGNIPGWKQSFLMVDEKSPGTASSWDQWVAPFLGCPNFVQAWVADTEYNYWQNAEDTMLYTSAGRDMSGLKLKSNGQHYPSERVIVDTSENPGRWEFRQGYIEAIGSPIWIGENLWRAIGENRENELRALDWLHLTEPQKGVLRVEYDFQFIDEATAAKQNALREAIYGPGK
ncbi:MAG TPA: hypothetical protein VHY79_06220 [Rhizomicrobium sp.]|jgi:hypothetical protein|nr:hypothetical protein [Rhizomicrobium sp.]